MKDTLNIYFILAIISTVLFPFTGILALDHILKARKMKNCNSEVLNLELAKTYYWIKVTLITLGVAYVLLSIALFSIYNYNS